MNCPTCGLPTLSDQKFCRSCGTSLRLTTQPLPEPAALSEHESRPAIHYKDAPQRPHNLTLVGFIIMFLGVALGVIGKKLIYQDVVTVIGILFSLVGIFLTVYPYLAPSRRKPDSTEPSQPEQLSQSQPVKTLPQESTTEYIPSITERTTDLLKNAPTRSKPNEGGESQS